MKSYYFQNLLFTKKKKWESDSSSSWLVILTMFFSFVFYFLSLDWLNTPSYKTIGCKVRFLFISYFNQINSNILDATCRCLFVFFSSVANRCNFLYLSLSEIAENWRKIFMLSSLIRAMLENDSNRQNVSANFSFFGPLFFWVFYFFPSPSLYCVYSSNRSLWGCSCHSPPLYNALFLWPLKTSIRK